MRSVVSPGSRLWRCAAALFLCPFVTTPASANTSDNEVVVTAKVRPDLFGTVAIPAPAGRWGDKWQKVVSDTNVPPALKLLVAPARNLSRRDQLDFIQAEIDRRIRWRSDGTQYGARTYWASASETLATGFGDDDDRAILKYQALRALGFPRSDFYLMMGRDKVRGDYVMLAARADGRWWLLEEQGDRPTPADGRHGFEPMASFGGGKSWVHGRPRSRTPATLLAAGVTATRR